LGEANSFRSLGDVARRQGRYEEAVKLYQQTLLMYRQIGDRSGEAGCLLSMARLAALQRDLNLAREGFDLAADIYTNIGLTGQAQQVRDEADAKR
jgi:G-protein signaling modulator 2